MRIKIKGPMPMKQVCLLLMSTLNKHGVTELTGTANFYIGLDSEKVVEVEGWEKKQNTKKRY